MQTTEARPEHHVPVGVPYSAPQPQFHPAGTMPAGPLKASCRFNEGEATQTVEPLPSEKGFAARRTRGRCPHNSDTLCARATRVLPRNALPRRPRGVPQHATDAGKCGSSGLFSISRNKSWRRFRNALIEQLRCTKDNCAQRVRRNLFARSDQSKTMPCDVSGDQTPLKAGLRFSRNALRPSA